MCNNMYFSNCLLLQDEMHKECRIIEGHFVSPLSQHLPGIMPPETEIARQVDVINICCIVLPLSCRTSLLLISSSCIFSHCLIRYSDVGNSYS